MYEIVVFGVFGENNPEIFGYGQPLWECIYLGMLVISKAIPAGNRQRHDKFSFSICNSGTKLFKLYLMV
jgi:hypothetical protein